ncbi:MAG TPA: cyclic nucleotide-binding domain-containing protein, partial [Candidatus Limnocylindrales bacterium]|nr:cyclic nucleotide-binding domain-containing protein [Candidatus Limnocylindrales bacterium]
HAIVHVRELRLLRSRSVFRALPPPTIEALSGHLASVQVPAGQHVFRQGDPGDRFYIIEEGSVAIEIGGRFVRKLGPGADFGEIALIRNVPRTASVRALDDVTLAALDGRVFVAAVTGHPVSRSVAEDLVRTHLGETATPG